MRKLILLTLFITTSTLSYARTWNGTTSERDYWLSHAIDVIKSTYGDTVYPENKNKDLLKFGRNQDVETASATLMTLPDGIDNETFLSDNLISRITSSSSSDTQVMRIEGHTISGSDLTFVTQDAILQGQSEVTLDTLLARATRAYNNGTTDLVGTIYLSQSDTYTSGVPDTDTKVHLMVRAGENQSEKASTSLSSIDYWVVTKFYCDVLTKTSAFAEVTLETREVGKVFRPIASISCSDSHSGVFEFKPYAIIPPNSDIRLVGTSDSATGRDVSGGIQGVLLKQ